jgi:hypothetical protein
MCENKQFGKANCTREEARALLEGLREAYQSLAIGDRYEVRDALTHLAPEPMPKRLRWTSNELVYGVR